jgi:hypothetical protein
MYIAGRRREIGGTSSISRRPAVGLRLTGSAAKPSSSPLLHARAVRRTGGRMRHSEHASVGTCVSRGMRHSGHVPFADVMPGMTVRRDPTVIF